MQRSQSGFECGGLMVVYFPLPVVLERCRNRQEGPGPIPFQNAAFKVAAKLSALTRKSLNFRNGDLLAPKRTTTLS